MDKLVTELAEAGLIQFGLFGEQKKPFQLRLDLLPSYPQLLRDIVAASVPFVRGFDRLVCTADSLPLGLALALETNIPLVYSRGRGQQAVNDLVGAYDIGHPALLLVQTLDDVESIEQFTKQAQQVGLGINSLLAIIATEKTGFALDIEVNALLQLTHMVDHLAAAGYLPDGHAQSIASWEANHHPG